MRSLPELKADCSRCAALCCMALPFDKGPSFALDKPALHPCPHLSHHACSIHESLSARGFSGCVRFDCLGAGQRVVAEVFDSADWQRDSTLRAPMAEALALLRRIHAGLELLVAAAALPLPPEREAERQALLRAYHPQDDWTEASLLAFAASDLPKRLQDFLTRLRPHV